MVQKAEFYLSPSKMESKCTFHQIFQLLISKWENIWPKNGCGWTWASAFRFIFGHISGIISPKRGFRLSKMSVFWIRLFENSAFRNKILVLFRTKGLFINYVTQVGKGRGFEEVLRCVTKKWREFKEMLVTLSLLTLHHFFLKSCKIFFKNQS